ncbi:MAG: LCP family protein [Nocardioides sp.]
MPTAPSPSTVARNGTRPRSETSDLGRHQRLSARRASAGESATAERATQVRFRRSLALMVMTVVAPGSAQLVAGNRRVGRIVLRCWLTVIGAGCFIVALGWLWPGFVFWLASSSAVLGVARVLLMLTAAGWVALSVDSWRLGQPQSLDSARRLAAVTVNGFVCFSVAGALLFGAHLVGVQRDFMLTTFGSGAVHGAYDGRFNVLLLGGDAGADRWGLRPDSITVASVDARTGRTVLIGLPRNLAKVPFAEGSVMAEQFPNGFDCDGCYLNAISTWAGDHPGLFGDSPHPGVDATVSAVEAILGLRVNYWAMVNLRGFAQLVDAMGGVTLDVRSPIPVGGLGDDVTGYIKPGRQKLNGADTLWFARAREGSDDYSRMARQKCVMNAIVTQISPQVAIRRFQQLARAGSQMISTNLPAGELDRFLELARKARSQQIATVSLVPPLVNTGDPDFGLIRDKVAAAIARAEGEPPAAGRGSGNRASGSGGSGDGASGNGPSGNGPDRSGESGDGRGGSATSGESPDRTVPVTGGSVGSLRTGYAANTAKDLAAVC